MKHLPFLKYILVSLCAAFFLPVLAQAVDTRDADIKILEPTSRTELDSFLAHGAGFEGGAAVAVGDLGGDGIGEIIVGLGPGDEPLVKIFRADGSLIRSFYAYCQ